MFTRTVPAFAAGIAFALMARERAREVAERPSELGWAPPPYRDGDERWEN